jgi:hypothetical protein
MTNNRKQTSTNTPAANEEADPEFVVGEGKMNRAALNFYFAAIHLFLSP